MVRNCGERNEEARSSRRRADDEGDLHKRKYLQLWEFMDEGKGRLKTSDLTSQVQGAREVQDDRRVVDGGTRLKKDSLEKSGGKSDRVNLDIISVRKMTTDGDLDVFMFVMAKEMYPP